MLVWFWQNLFTTTSSEWLSVSNFCRFQRIYRHVLNKSEMRSTNSISLCAEHFLALCSPLTPSSPPTLHLSAKEGELPQSWLIPTNFQLREHSQHSFPERFPLSLG